MSSSTAAAAPLPPSPTPEQQTATNWKKLARTIVSPAWAASNVKGPRPILPEGARPDDFWNHAMVAYNQGMMACNAKYTTGAPTIPTIPGAEDAATAVAWEFFNQGFQHALSAAVVSPPPASRSGADIKLNKPQAYSGSREDFDIFVNQIMLWFNSYPDRYDTDIRKMTFVASFLDGNAKRWWSPHQDQVTGRISFSSYEDFFKHFRAAFADPDAKATAERKLKALKQGKDTASAYHAKFMSHASLLDMGDDTLMSMF